MDEVQYLETYKASDYPIVLVTVDTVLFTFVDSELYVLLVQRNNHPEKGKWGLPGGFLDQKEDNSLEAAALRSVKSKTGIYPSYLEQLETIGSRERDPRGWSISTSYTALVPFIKCQKFVASVSDAKWIPVTEAIKKPLAFDHKKIIKLALNRQRQKALYSFIPVFGLEQSFTITDLRKAHETLIGKDIQRKSFIRRFESSQMFLETGEYQNERGRPAMLYKAKPNIKNFTFVRNLEES